MKNKAHPQFDMELRQAMYNVEANEANMAEMAGLVTRLVSGATVQNIDVPASTSLKWLVVTVSPYRNTRDVVTYRFLLK